LSAASGGQIRKIAIARALASKPTLLITDEPTADLDEISAKVIIQLIRRFATDPDRGVIIITHDESLIIVSDEIVRYDR
jgi:ABC-type lipoprotein export system ATPase subunit